MNTNSAFKASQKNAMLDCVKGSTQIQKSQNRGRAIVCSCLSTVSGSHLRYKGELSQYCVLADKLNKLMDDNKDDNWQSYGGPLQFETTCHGHRPCCFNYPALNWVWDEQHPLTDR